MKQGINTTFNKIIQKMKMRNINILFLIFILAIGTSKKASAENAFELHSPDKKITIQLTVEKTIQLSAFFENKQIFDLKNIALIENEQSNSLCRF
jgi:hypothetical protein